ncbi:hypothetical protein G7Y79_00042g078520 [Physcia stellaris]|nr:hypothetical protein G7Y79_00042g078520 [Physcia stellaris]
MHERLRSDISLSSHSLNPTKDKETPPSSITALSEKINLKNAIPPHPLTLIHPLNPSLETKIQAPSRRIPKIQTTPAPPPPILPSIHALRRRLGRAPAFPGPNTTSASSYNKDHGFLKIPTRRHVPRRRDALSSRTWGQEGRRGSSSGGGSEGDSATPVPRGLRVVELGDPFPLDGLMEVKKGEAVRLSAVAERVDGRDEDAPVGCRMVELREPVPIDKLVEKQEREMGKGRGRDGVRTVRIGMSG